MSSVTLENVRLIFRNFTGKEGQYNREGDKNFSILLDPDIAEKMIADGWNVKSLAGREDADGEIGPDQPYIQVAVNFKGRPPHAFMVGATSSKKTLLDENTVELLDYADIQTCDVIIRPYSWEVAGKTGIKAYLQTIYAVVDEDPLALKYANAE